MNQKNIISKLGGKSIFFLEYKTGNNFEAVFPKENVYYLSHEYKLIVKNNSKIEYVCCCVENLFMDRIDGFYKRRSTIRKKSAAINLEMECGITKQSNSQIPFLLFSTQEKLNGALKDFVLPKLIKEKMCKSDELIKEYHDLADEINSLQNELNILS